MTNRKKIAEMKVVDFFARYSYWEYNDFDDFISGATVCSLCPKKEDCNNMLEREDCNNMLGCKRTISEWLDEECEQ